jgi:hypothetical protein
MKKTGFIAGGVLLGVGAFALFILVVMLLWNWLMPTIFNLQEITFWQSAGILVLAKILFSGFGHEHKWHSDRKKKIWHQRFKEKFENMPEDKKKYFFHRMDEKCGHSRTETDGEGQEK